MFADLNSFYHSNEWRKFLKALRIERVNDDGQVICDYCGKPIIKAYDCIGHHKLELTEENVNDFTISLNPENVGLVHHRCHNYIHDKLGHTCRQVYIVYGAPLSGKTTYVRNSMSDGDLIIDLDNIWQCVSGLDRYMKPGRLKAVVFRLRDELLDVVKYRFGKWNNAYIIGGYPLKSERERLVKELGAREVYIDTSKEECIERLAADDMRVKEEWMKYIDDWFEMFSQ